MAENLSEMAPAWPAETKLSRLDVCRAMLSLHGLLTDAQNRAVHRKLAKLRVQGEAAARKEGQP